MMHYTDAELGAMLESVDSELTPEAATHLESCEVCRKRLGTLSGEGAWLSDLLDSVGDATRDLPSGAAEPDSLTDEHHSAMRSIVIALHSSDGMPDEIQCDAVRLNFLEPPAHPELLGRLGRYDIERLIGMGGYGIVFKARDSELNRAVAIKVLAPHLMHSGPARQRFAREAQASAAVVHDHVVPIFDVVANGKICYFVMQYIAGESLQERVDRLGPLPMEDVLRIGSQIAAGLQAAHAQGLIHRDVKPGNVLLEDSVNRVMISDFGLARAADDASLTRSGTITGTPHYMSPEQARGQAIDHRSDLFSLGSVLYFMCTGHSPFRAPQMMAVLNRICHEPHRPVEQLNAEVPAELADVIHRLLSKRPEGRYATAAEVHDELQRLLNDLRHGQLRPRRLPTGNYHAITRVGAILSFMAIMATLIWRFDWWQATARPSGESTEIAAADDSDRIEASLGIKGMAIAGGGINDIDIAVGDTDDADATGLEPDPTTVFTDSMPTWWNAEMIFQDFQGIVTKVEFLERLQTLYQPNLDTRAGWDEELRRLEMQLQQLERDLGSDGLESR